MKICQSHWEMLRQAIKDRNIDHLVARSGEELCENIEAELDGRESDYDPLMDCNNMIWSSALQMGGLYLMMGKEDGTSFCPVCEAVDHGQNESDWINGPSDAALQHCRELGLAPPLQ